MKKQDDTEPNVILHENVYSKKLLSKLMKRQPKNGISPWKETENTKNGLHISQERNQSTSLPLHSKTTKALPLSNEDCAEDFNTELTSLKELELTCFQTACNEYMPYYRTDTKLVENPLNLNREANLESSEEEDTVHNDKYICKPKYEEESINEMEFDFGYVSYYRTYEEYLSNSDLPVETQRKEESKEDEANSDENMKSVSTETIYNDSDFQENNATNEDTNQCHEKFDFKGTLEPINSIVESCDSENRLSEETLNLNQSPSSNGYFPYYRTYGKLLPPDESINFCSSSDILGELGRKRERSREGNRNSSNSCQMC